MAEQRLKNLDLVNNDAFNAALSNQDNRRIMFSAGNRYQDCIREDELDRCRLIGLWKCLQRHDPQSRRKFTTSLYLWVGWECKTLIDLRIRRANKRKKYFMPHKSEGLNGFESIDLQDCLEQLPTEDRTLVEMRFFEGRTFNDIGEVVGCTGQSASDKIDNVLKKLKVLCT